jgi:hypothetical protein
MLEYFRRKVASVITRTVYTGNKSAMGNPPYARRYEAEILEVIEGRAGGKIVLVNVQSEDLHPSGGLAGGTHHYHGDHHIPVEEVNGLEEFWSRTLILADTGFAKYLRRRG